VHPDDSWLTPTRGSRRLAARADSWLTPTRGSRRLAHRDSPHIATALTSPRLAMKVPRLARPLVELGEMAAVMASRDVANATAVMVIGGRSFPIRPAGQRLSDAGERAAVDQSARSCRRRCLNARSAAALTLAGGRVTRPAHDSERPIMGQSPRRGRNLRVFCAGYAARCPRPVGARHR